MKYLLFLFCILLIGCTNNVDTANDNRSSYGNDMPEWLFNAMKNNLDNPSVLRKEDVTYSYVHMKESGPAQILAYMKIDQLNGALCIFDSTGEGYKQVYLSKEPVYELTILNPQRQIISYVSGFSGTGILDTKFHLLAYTNNSFKEIWSGLAEKNNFTGPLPGRKTIGDVHVDGLNIIHTTTEMLYNKQEFDIKKPDKQTTTVQFIPIDPETYTVKDTSVRS